MPLTCQHLPGKSELQKSRACTGAFLTTSKMEFLCLLMLLVVPLHASPLHAGENHRCPMPTHDVPVQPNFDVHRFSGLWYTIATTTYIWGDYTWDSPSRKILVDRDGTTSMAYSGKSGDQCIPVEMSRLEETSGPGDYLDIHGHDKLILKVTFTDYSHAVVFFCLMANEDGTCRHNRKQVEIWSRTEDNSRHARFGVEDYVTDLCVDVTDLVDTTPGLCDVPVLLGDLFRDQSNASDQGVRNSDCLVREIHIQDGFHFNKMSGLWYDIARTMFTVNTMESSIAYHTYDAEEDVMNSYYTGTQDGECQSALYGRTKRNQEGGPYGDMLGRIGGADDMFPWASFKMMYADSSYQLFYACYEKATDGTCMQNKQEVVLAGRKRTIDPELRVKLAERLTDVCLSPSDLIDIQFEANCSKWVTHNEHVLDRDCVVDHISAQSSVDMEEFLGTWYVVKSKEFSLAFQPRSGVFTFSRGQDDAFLLRITAIAYENGTCEDAPEVYIWHRCRDAASGDFVSSYRSGRFRQWSAFKILYTDYKVAVLYMCLREMSDGTCDDNGRVVYVLSRNSKMGANVSNNVIGSVIGACVRPDEMVPTTDHCLGPITLHTTPVGNHMQLSCAVNNILPMQKFDQSKITGYWYEIARSPEARMGLDSGLSHYSLDSQGNMLVRYTGTSGDDTCYQPLKYSTKPQCTDHIDGHYFGRPRFMGSGQFVTWKILYTDYEHLMVTFVCLDVSHDGTCSYRGTQLHMLSRLPSLNETYRQRAEQVISAACMDPGRLWYPARIVDCTDSIEEDLYAIQEVQNRVAAIANSDGTCILDKITTADNFTPDKILGSWYLTHYKTPKSSQQQRSGIFTFSRWLGETLSLSITGVIARDNTCEERTEGLIKPRCSPPTGDYIRNQRLGTLRVWNTLKFLHVDEQSAVVYWCTQETSDGVCLPEGVTVYVLGKTTSLTPDTHYRVNTALRRACLDPRDIKTATGSDGCVIRPPADNVVEDEPQCAVDRLPIVDNFDQNLFTGYWYEVLRTPDPKFSLNSGLVHYSIHPNGNLRVLYAGSTPDLKCVGPVRLMTKSRCPNNINGDYLGRMDMPDNFVFGPWKVLHTDYDHVAVAYTCMDMIPSGLCSPGAARLHILSRTPVLDSDLKLKMYDVVRSACLDPTELEEPGSGVHCFTIMEDLLHTLSTDQEGDGSGEKVDSPNGAMETVDIIAEDV